MNESEFLNWYEASLPVSERKKRGHFSTPPSLVEQILDACGYTPERDLSSLRVLDPACGSGNFLVGAARRLLASAQQHQLTSRMLLSRFARNLWGFDPDPVACFLAEMQVRSVLQDYLSSAGQSPRAKNRPYKITSRLHIHQGDGLALPWQNYQGVDLFLANPPYLAAKNTDLSGYHQARQRGQVDSYLLFMDLALQVVRRDGWIALVLPDPVLARANAAHERRRLLTEATIHHLWHLSGVFSAHVGAAVIIAQKRPPTRLHQVPWVRGQWQSPIEETSSRRASVKKENSVRQALHLTTSSTMTVPLSLLQRQPQGEIRYMLSNISNTLLERLHTAISEARTHGLNMLGDLVQIRRGEELNRNSTLLLPEPDNGQGQRWYRVLRGGLDIRPYVQPGGRFWIEQAQVDKPMQRYLEPKLMVVKSTGQLQATLDLQGHVVLQTLYLLNLRSTLKEQLLQKWGEQGVIDELYFLLALLNSCILRDYVYVLHTAYKWVQPQIEQYVLTHLPIPSVDETRKAPIIQRARILERICSATDAVVEWKEQEKELYEEQEQAICSLYEAALLETIPVSSMQYVDKGVTSYG